MYCLQKIIFPKTRMQNIKNLYYNVVFGHAEFVHSDLFLTNNSKISFNSYFNSFYEAYWRKFTGLEKIKLKLFLQGAGIVALYRDTKFNGCYELSVTNFQTSTMRELIIETDLQDILMDMGRVFIDITSSEDTIIKSIEFITEEKIEKTLSVGICTFNREDFLLKNLKSLLNLKKDFDNLQKVFVVNQGDAFTNAELNVLLEENTELFTILKQGNLGGTGGFTRTLYEAIKSGNYDFHLLMDDDVIIDSNVIKTAFAFASTAKKPIAVGGQMLDLLRPNFLHEYGAKVDDKGYIRGLFHNLDMTNLGSLTNFNDVNTIDYNAWWFCMIPTEAIRNVNLPAPIFIRGDDEEYGLRLKKNGVETVALPGVALWHEPFYVKVGGWQTYYDFRNRMILSSSYPEMINESASRLFLRIYNLLLVHDYQSVKLILEAIKDFSKGTKLFQQSLEEIHTKVSGIAKSYMPKSVDVAFRPIPDDKIKPAWDTNTRRINFAKQTVLLSTLDFSKKSPRHLWDRHVNPQNVACKPYIKSNGIQSYHYLYTPNKILFKEILKEILEAQQLYISTIKNNDWHTLDKTKDVSYWRDIFSKQG